MLVPNYVKFQSSTLIQYNCQFQKIFFKKSVRTVKFILNTTNYLLMIQKFPKMNTNGLLNNPNVNWVSLTEQGYLQKSTSLLSIINF